MQSTDQKLKIKLLVGIIGVFIILIGAFYYIFYQEEKAIFTLRMQTKKELTSSLLNQLSSDLNKEMMIIVENIVCNNGIIKAIEENNRDQLLKYTFNIYKLLKNENPEYSIMHFHRADSTSFLRLHNLKKYDDNLSEIRPMIESIHKNHIRTSGFEMGKFDNGLLTYRVAVPIFNQNKKYIGALELGINAQVFIKRLKNSMLGNNENGAFYIKKESINHLKGVVNTKKECIQAYKTDGFIDRKIYDTMKFNSLKVTDNTQTFMIVKKDGFVKDYNNKSLGTFVLQFNITNDINHFYHFLRTIIILLLLLFMIVFLQVYYGFNRFINYIHKERENVSLEKDKLKNEQNKVQAILNAQSNILILSDGVKLRVVNQAFLDFFSMSELKNFTLKHNCVCDMFIEHSDFFSLDKISKEKNWIVYLKNQPPEKRRITLLDSNLNNFH